MYYYLADHLCRYGGRICDHLGRMGDIEIELTTIGAFQRTVRHGADSHLAMDYTTLVCGNYGALIRVSQGMVWHWFAMSIFYVLCRMHSGQILALLAIVRLAEVD